MFGTTLKIFKSFKMRKFYFLLVLPLTFYSCKKPDKIRIENVSPINHVVDLNDTIFFSHTEQVYYSNRILINDHQRSKIYICNSTLDSLFFGIGERGNGPGEIGFSNAIRVTDDDVLHVLDDNNGRIHRFDIHSGKFIGDTKLQTRMPPFSKFVVANFEYLILNNLDEQPPMVVYNFDGNIIRRFGDYYDFEGNFARSRNQRILHYLDKGYIISAFIADPIIEIHNLKGELIKSYKIQIPLIQESYDISLKKYFEKNAENFTSTLFKELIVGQNSIYILFFDKASEKLNNQILEIDKTAILDSLIFKRIIKIEDNSDVALFGGMFPFENDTKMVIQNIVSGKIMILSLK